MVVADPSAWAKKDKYAMYNNEMTFEDACRNEGVYLQKAVNDRVQGWWALKDVMTRKLDIEINGKIISSPQYYVFDIYNKPFIEELIAAIGDEHNPEDIQGRGNDPNVSDHALDEERYKIMAIYKPIDKKAIEEEKLKQQRLIPYPHMTNYKNKLHDKSMKF